MQGVTTKEIILIATKLTKQNVRIIKKRLKQTMKKTIKPSKKARKSLKKIGMRIEEE